MVLIRQGEALDASDVECPDCNAEGATIIRVDPIKYKCNYCGFTWEEGDEEP